MPKSIPSIIKEDEVTLFIDGETQVINDGHMNYLKIREALADEDFDRVRGLINVAATINAFGDGKVTVEDGIVMYNGNALRNVITSRIIMMQREGFNIAPMIAFLSNLMDNPSHRSVTELYGFLEKTDLPITEDGHFIAYKMVRNNYTDHHSGTFDNSVGAIVEMPRNEVNDDKEQTCSSGLHFCSQGYLGFYGGDGHTMILKVNPRDVVSIPTDYNDAKGRACRYEVIGELETESTKEHSFSTTVFTDTFGSDMQGDKYVLITLEEAGKRLGMVKDEINDYIDQGIEIVATNDGVDMVRWYVDLLSGGYAEIAFTDGHQIIETLVSLNEAAETLCGDAMNPKAALRKRIRRGSVQTRVVDDVEMVVLLSS